MMDTALANTPSPSAAGNVRDCEAPALPPYAQARHLLAEMEIRLIETREHRREGETCAIATVQRIIDEHSDGHAVTVLRTVAESEGNARQLIGPVLWAISDLALAHPDWVAKGLEWLEAFDDVDLAMVVNEARLNRAACPLRPAIATLLHAMLRPVFAPDGRVRRRRYRRRTQPDQEGNEHQAHTALPQGEAVPHGASAR